MSKGQRRAEQEVRERLKGQGGNKLSKAELRRLAKKFRGGDFINKGKNRTREDR